MLEKTAPQPAELAARMRPMTRESATPIPDRRGIGSPPSGPLRPEQPLPCEPQHPAGESATNPRSSIKEGS